VSLLDKLSDVSKDGGIVKDAVSDSGLDNSLTVFVKFDIADGTPTEEL
jgi:hypothetical protein